PGLRGHLHGLVLEAVGRVAWHEIKPPEKLTVVRVVCGDEAAHAEIGTAVADDDLAVEDARRARDRVWPLVVRERLRTPDRLARRAIQRDEPAVERRDDDLVLPGRESARDGLAAGVPP